MIDETISRHRALGVPWKWVVHPCSRPRDLADRLARRAADAWDARAMYADPRRPIAGAPIEVERVEPGDPRFAAVFAEGWGSDPAQTAADLRASPPSHRHFLALDGGQPVGAATSVARERSIHLTAAAVLPAHRGKGAYRALVRARAIDAAERGHTLVTTQARDATSAPILARLGFRTAFAMRCFVGE